MLSITNATNNTINFGAKKPVSNPEPQETRTSNNNRLPNKAILSTMAMLMYLNAAQAETPQKKAIFVPEVNIETVEDISNDDFEQEINPTQLLFDELVKAPDPTIKVAGKNVKAGIVVDLSENKLYRYNSEGVVQDGYHVASGILGKNGKSITHTGIRKVDHIETYPYSSAKGSKRARSPKAFGPKILYLTIVDPQTGANRGSNGEFIHGNNDASSIGTYASHGCIRMDNEVIKKLAAETKTGTYVLIK